MHHQRNSETTLQNLFSAMNPPIKKTNAELRTREYLTQQEIDQVRKAARRNTRNGHRDDTLILMMFRHALRVGEAINLRWEQVNLNQGLLHVRRLKKGIPATHPLQGTSLRALRLLKRLYPNTPYLFVTERNTPLTPRTAHYIIARAGQAAGLPFPIHPHMLRHSTGFYLANRENPVDTRAIQAYMGHANISNTVVYTHLSAHRFKDFWQG